MTARDRSTPRRRLPAGRSILILVATVPFISCADGADDRSATPLVAEQPAPIEIDTQVVRNATYMSQFTESGFVTLTAGEYESDEPEWRVNVGLDRHIAIGDLDGDALFFARNLTITGNTEAVVCLRNALDDIDGSIAENVADMFGPPGRAALGTLRRTKQRSNSK